ncbi:Asd/ArgC dimerization domain-containing protein [Chitinibacteraceae bacterium HSL-7]
MPALNLALLGATTSQAAALLDVIADSPLRLPAFFPLTTSDDPGLVEFREEDHPEVEVDGFDWSLAPVLVNCQPDALDVMQAAAAASVIVIDLTGSVPPGGKLGRGQIVAMPAPFAQQLVSVVQPLAELGTLTSVSATGMLAVSTEGQAGMDELSGQTRALFAQGEHLPSVYDKRIAYNILGAVGHVDATGATPEEGAALALLDRLLPQGCDRDVSCVRTPHFFGHGATISLRFTEPVTRDAVIAALGQSERVFVATSPCTTQDAIGADKVWVSRVRAEGKAVTLWTVADNTRLPALAVLQLLTLVAGA